MRTVRAVRGTWERKDVGKDSPNKALMDGCEQRGKAAEHTLVPLQCFL